MRARRVRRYCKVLLVSTGGEFTEIEGAGLSGEKEVALAFSLGGGGFPLVHGCRSGEGVSGAGEYSLLSKGATGFYGERDGLGTRGLWVVRAGPNAGSLASDYRLLPGGRLAASWDDFRTRQDKEGHGTPREEAGHRIVRRRRKDSCLARRGVSQAARPGARAGRRVVFRWSGQLTAGTCGF